MSDLYNESVVLQGRKVVQYSKMMERLKKKPNKTSEEELVLSSYSKFMKLSIVISLVFTVVIISIMLIYLIPGGAADSFFERGYGTVEGDKVRYTQDEVKYVDINELNLDKDKVSEGDRITLEFDSKGMLTGRAVITELEDAKDKRNAIVLAVSLLFVIIGTVLVVVLMRKTVGKPFMEFILKNTCRKCGMLNIAEVGSDEWVCVKCNKLNNVSSDYTEYVKKDKRETMIWILICIVISLLLAPIYLKVTDTSYLPDSLKELEWGSSQKVFEKDSAKESQNETESLQVEEGQKNENTDNDALKSVEDNADKINSILESIN